MQGVQLLCDKPLQDTNVYSILHYITLREQQLIIYTILFLFVYKVTTSFETVDFI